MNFDPALRFAAAAFCAGGLLLAPVARAQDDEEKGAKKTAKGADDRPPGVVALPKLDPSQMPKKVPPKKAEDFGKQVREIADPVSLEDHWRAIEFELKFERYDAAKRYLDLMMALPDATPTALLDLRDKYGSGTLVTLAIHPELGANAAKLLRVVNEASRAKYGSADYIRSQVAALSKSESERAAARQRLRVAGEAAVPLLAEAILAAPAKPELRDALVNLPTVVWPSIATLLESGEPVLQDAALDALAAFRHHDSAEVLWYWAAAPKAAAEIRAKARAALAGVVPNPDPALAPAALLAIARAYDDRNGPRDLDLEFGRIWAWKDGKPVVATVPARAAELHYGVKNAEAALAVAPGLAAARELRVRLLLERGAEADLADADARDPALVDAALRQAIALQKSAAALGAVRQLGKLGDAAPIAGLAQALDYPDPRVQFDAARALVARGGDFVGADRLAPILARAADSSRRPLAIIVDRDASRAGGVASQFVQLGYETRTYQNGRAAFTDVAESGAAAMVVLDPDLRAPSTRDLVAELRRDSRTSAVPIVIFKHEQLVTAPEPIRRPITDYEREQIRLRQDKQTRLESERNEMFGVAVRVPEREKKVYSLSERVDFLTARLGYIDDPVARAKLYEETPDYILVPQKASVDGLTLRQRNELSESRAAELAQLQAKYQGVAVLARIADAANLGRALELVFEDALAKPLSPEERFERRDAALDLLAKMVADPRHAGALAGTGLHITELLTDEFAGPKAARILAAIPSPKHQRELAGVATAGPLPVAVRRACADALLAAFEKGGVGVDNPTKVAIVRAAASAPKGPLADSLSKLVARFGPKAVALEKKLRSELPVVEPPSAPPEPKFAAPAPGPKKEEPPKKKKKIADDDL